jgi:hypothetical protein
MELQRFKVDCVPAVLSRPASNFFHPACSIAWPSIIGLGRAQTKRALERNTRP